MGLTPPQTLALELARSEQLLSATADLAETVLIAIGGVWALYVYLRTRRGQIQVGIEASWRIIPEWNPGQSLLLVKIRLANTSNVIYHHQEAAGTLLDARRETASGRKVRLVPFGQADPLLAVYGDIDASKAAIQEGDVFRLDPRAVSLEPGEHVESEMPFVLDSDRLGLMALRVLVRGRQRKSLFPRDYWWGSFFYISPGHEGEVESEPQDLEMGRL